MNKIPQANSLDKIKMFIEMVANGIESFEEIATRQTFSGRQAQYYAEASKILGFIDYDKSRAHLTSLGKEYIESNHDERVWLLYSAILENEIIKDIVEKMGGKYISCEDIYLILKDSSEFSDSTIRRRAETIFSWLKWVSKIQSDRKRD
jgi:hypothetical protein